MVVSSSRKGSFVVLGRCRTGPGGSVRPIAGAVDVYTNVSVAHDETDVERTLGQAVARP
jgi:hypothetical protein